MKIQHFAFFSCFLVLLLFLGCGEAYRYVLVNGKQSELLISDSNCKLEITTHITSETFLEFEMVSKECDLKINKVNEWIEMLTKANNLDVGSIKIRTKNTTTDIENLIIRKGKKWGFTVVKRVENWNNREINFVFPKNNNFLVQDSPFFKETRILSLELDKMRFIF